MATMEKWPEQLFSRVSETYNENTKAIAQLQETIDAANQKLVVLEATQQTVVEQLGGSISQMTDGWAQQIIQENKAAAFTLQSKLGVMAELQSKRDSELQDGIAGKLQLLVNASAEGLGEKVVQHTLKSTEQCLAKIEATSNLNLSEHKNLDSNLTAMIKEMQSDNAKHVEAGIGVFGNSLRAQLDTMASTQVSQRMEAEQNMATKMDGLLGRMQQQSQKQVESMNEVMDSNIQSSLEKYMKPQMSVIKEMRNSMEDVNKTQTGRHQDMTSMVTSVLEQACGAKARAEECAQGQKARAEECAQRAKTRAAEDHQRRGGDFNMEVDSRQTTLESLGGNMLDSRNRSMSRKSTSNSAANGMMSPRMSS